MELSYLPRTICPLLSTLWLPITTERIAKVSGNEKRGSQACVRVLHLRYIVPNRQVEGNAGDVCGFPSCFQSYEEEYQQEMLEHTRVQHFEPRLNTEALQLSSRYRGTGRTKYAID